MITEDQQVEAGAEYHSVTASLPGLGDLLQQVGDVELDKGHLDGVEGGRTVREILSFFRKLSRILGTEAEAKRWPTFSSRATFFTSISRKAYLCLRAWLACAPAQVFCGCLAELSHA